MSSVQDQVAQFLEGVARNRREILTPEGVALPVDLADHGERVVALIIDLFIWMCVTALLFVAIIAFIVEGKAVEIGVTMMLFIAFIVRNLYFVYFELAWQGATPGKWITSLRVIDRRGGPLTPSAVFARNLTREVEMFVARAVHRPTAVQQGSHARRRLHRRHRRDRDSKARATCRSRRQPQSLHVHARAARCLRRLRKSWRNCCGGHDRPRP
jgi:uncharacterized RDD family membrane protein YckC